MLCHCSPGLLPRWPERGQADGAPRGVGEPLLGVLVWVQEVAGGRGEWQVLGAWARPCRQQPPGPFLGHGVGLGLGARAGRPTLWHRQAAPAPEPSGKGSPVLGECWGPGCPSSWQRGPQGSPGCVWGVLGARP